MIRTALTAAVGLLLCAGATAPAQAQAPSPASPTQAHSPSPAHPPVRTHSPAHAYPPHRADVLRITYDDGRGGVTTRVLRCHPTGGSMPDAAQACRTLDALGGPIRPGAQREMCSMIFGGPQTARVSGIWRGRRVDETYTRNDGCQNARWQRMVPVLPEPANDPRPAPGTPHAPGHPEPRPVPHRDGTSSDL